MNRLKSLSLACALGALSLQAQAAPVTLTFDSLPSAQGWTYVTNPVSAVTEASVFSVSSGVLVQNTIGWGDGRNYYERSDGVDWTRPFTMRMRSRLVADVGSLSRPGGPLGAFGFYAFAGSEAFAAIFRPNVIQNYAQANVLTAFDTSAFHDYQLEVTPGSGYRLSVDGVLVNTGAPVAIGGPARLLLGDGTFNVAARAEVSFYEVTQGSRSIPEPGSLLLAGLALAAMLGSGASLRPSMVVFRHND